jgi:hypothetical protein
MIGKTYTKLIVPHQIEVGVCGFFPHQFWVWCHPAGAENPTDRSYGTGTARSDCPSTTSSIEGRDVKSSGSSRSLYMAVCQHLVPL